MRKFQNKFAKRIFPNYTTKGSIDTKGSYIGKAENQKKIANKLGGNRQLLAAFITRITNAIHKKGRKVIIWGEYPLVKSDVTSLPNTLSDDEIAQGDLANGRVSQILKAIKSSIDSGQADLMGMIVCGWADSGLNPEIFWLGYASGLAAAWNNQKLNAEDFSDRFFKSFYGEGSSTCKGFIRY